jgi:hypothetical protein
VGLYAAGSLTTGDYRPATSDLGRLTLALAELTRREGRLVPKDEALGRLPARGVRRFGPGSAPVLVAAGHTADSQDTRA